MFVTSFEDSEEIEIKTIHWSFFFSVSYSFACLLSSLVFFRQFTTSVHHKRCSKLDGTWNVIWTLFCSSSSAMVAAGFIIFSNVVSQKFYIGDLPKFQ